jgi:hypothetical protein
MEPEFLILSRNCWSNVDTHEISSDRQEYWKVQLPYFRKHNIKKEDCTSKSDYWLYNIANMDTMEELAFKEKDSDFVYLSELAEFRAMSIPEQDRYIRQIDREVVWKNVMDRKYRFVNIFAYSEKTFIFAQNILTRIPL